MRRKFIGAIARIYSEVGHAAILGGTVLVTLARVIDDELDGEGHRDPAAAPADKREPVHADVEPVERFVIFNLYPRPHAAHRPN